MLFVYFVIDDVSISGFKEALSEQNSTEGASVILGQEADEAQSPDAISAASQSIDEPTKDLVINLTVLSFLFFRMALVGFRTDHSFLSTNRAQRSPRVQSQTCLK